MAAEIAETSASLPYHEPGIIDVILVLTSFILLLNILMQADDDVILSEQFCIADIRTWSKYFTPIAEGKSAPVTNIAVPTSLSYALQGLLNVTPLQAFAAGAALRSTSLDMAFTVFGSGGLSASRLRVDLTSPATMDDARSHGPCELERLTLEFRTSSQHTSQELALVGTIAKSCHAQLLDLLSCQEAAGAQGEATGKEKQQEGAGRDVLGVWEVA